MALIVKKMCNSLQKDRCVVYSFGSNGEVTFEQALLNLTNQTCEIHIFDYSLNSANIQKVHSVSGAILHLYGIGPDNSVVEAPFHNGEQTVKHFQLKNLSSIMSELNHSWVDVLKMDVEGAEYTVLPSIISHYKALNMQIPVTQAQIEYHHSKGNPKMTHLVQTLKLMESSGFRAFSTEYNVNGEAYNYVEYSYLNVDQEGNIAYRPKL